MFRLDNKIAAITGAGSGIGAATAALFASAGAFVYVLERNPETGRAVVDEIRAAGGRAELIGTDVSSEASCRAAAARSSPPMAAATCW